MKKILFSLGLFTVLFFPAAAQTDSAARRQDTATLTAAADTLGIDSIEQRIVLIGDAGELHAGGHPVVDWVKEHVDLDDERNLIVYLGDNIYPLGLPTEGEPSYQDAKAIIDYQIN